VISSFSQKWKKKKELCDDIILTEIWNVISEYHTLGIIIPTKWTFIQRYILLIIQFFLLSRAIDAENKERLYGSTLIIQKNVAIVSFYFDSIVFHKSYNKHFLIKEKPWVENQIYVIFMIFLHTGILPNAYKYNICITYKE
jgi:hypothetical protein